LSSKVINYKRLLSDFSTFFDKKITAQMLKSNSQTL